MPVRSYAAPAQYKSEDLGIQAHGTFRRDGKEHAHILPLEHQFLNLLEPARGYLRDYLATCPAVTLHRDFHHLNSSQAFAFNLFFRSLHRAARNRARCFARSGRRASLALGNRKRYRIPLRGQMWTVKLSESQFGSAIPNKHHSKKREEIYLSRLQGCVEPKILLPEAFFANYQLLRNLWHIACADRSFLVFLLPRANAALWDQVQAFHLRVRASLVARVSVIAIEDVLSRIAVDPICPEDLKKYVQALKRKYVPYSSQI